MELNKLKGIYLVLDPTRNWDELMQKLELALQGGLNVVQIWNHWEEPLAHAKKLEFLEKIKVVCAPFHIPILMHDDWRMALEASLDGVHFDQIPVDFKRIQEVLTGKILGLTVGNDLGKIKWADQNGLQYISFCSVFPSTSVDTCEIVRQETIKEARTITELPIFLSGGIKVEKLKKLKELKFDGLAIISGILDAPDPAIAVKNYKNEFQNIIK